jgi:hypothetical protein
MLLAASPCPALAVEPTLGWLLARRLLEQPQRLIRFVALLSTQVEEVPAERKSLNMGDVFILDSAFTLLL